MSDHAADIHGHAAEGAAAVDGLRFEKSELQEFVEEDQYAGRAIGKLLAATFFVLVFLMTGVAWWTNRHQFMGQDPHASPAATTSPAGH